MLKITLFGFGSVTVALDSLFRIFSSFVSATYVKIRFQSRSSSEFWNFFLGPVFSTKPATIFVSSLFI